MEHYKRGEVKEIVENEQQRLPFSNELIGDDIHEMKIRSGTKIKNIISFITKLFEVSFLYFKFQWV